MGSGIVSADLDKAIADGLGLRWSFMGPMQTIHLNAPEGVADYVNDMLVCTRALIYTQIPIIVGISLREKLWRQN